jgi:hypothetical protein
MKASNLEEVGQIRRRRGTSMNMRMNEHTLPIVSAGSGPGGPLCLQENDAEYDQKVEVEDVGNA